MLLLENSGRQRFRRVVVEHGDRALHDHRTIVETRGDQMYRDPGDPDAVSEGLTLRIRAWKRWQEGWVDVDDGVGERLEQRRPYQAHEAGQADNAHPALAKGGDERTLVVVASRPATMADVERLDACGSRFFQTGGVLTIGDDDGDRSVEAPADRGVDQCLQVAAATGNQYAKTPTGIERRRTRWSGHRYASANRASLA